MVPESHWLNFYLSCGGNVFVFIHSEVGRSTGNPSPVVRAADGNAFARFLKERGATQLGVHSRSIVGSAGCHLAKKYLDLINIIIKDILDARAGCQVQGSASLEPRTSRRHRVTRS